MHIHKCFERKFIFRLKKLVYGLRRVAVASRWASIARSVPSKVQNCHSTLGHSPHIASKYAQNLHIQKKIQYFCPVKLPISDEISFC